MNKYVLAGGVVILLLLSVILYLQRGGTAEEAEQGTSADLAAITPLPTEEQEIFEEDDATITPMQGDVTELIVEDLVVGTGTEAVAGKQITVNYRGTLLDGTQFDSSYDRGQPFSFVLGSGQVIQGWEKGFAGMRIGGKRKLTIPPELGYGSRDMGTIPPNSVLIFEVELLEVE
jgi:FKBP-type peptidyl-prolyl cis-trans isomerase